MIIIDDSMIYQLMIIEIWLWGQTSRP